MLRGDEFAKILHQTRVLLIGERHDHPDHHLLQAQILRLFSQEHPKSTLIVAFEMLDQDDEEILKKNYKNSQDFEDDTKWDKSGWPTFSLYKPIIDALVDLNAIPIAGSPTRTLVHKTMKTGIGALEQNKEALSLLRRNPLSPSKANSLRKQIIESHCGYANPSLIKAMTIGQRLKDAWMAQRMVSSLRKKPHRIAALIAGNGHTRRDRGVPHYIRELDGVLTIGLFEIRADKAHPADYELSNFDIVIFTPRLNNDDPCKKFRQSLERMKMKNENTKRNNVIRE